MTNNHITITITTITRAFQPQHKNAESFKTGEPGSIRRLYIVLNGSKHLAQCTSVYNIHVMKNNIILLYLCLSIYPFFISEKPVAHQDIVGDGYRCYLTILYSCMFELYLIVYNRNNKPQWEHFSKRKKVSALSW